jgi:hypothetical protein
MIAKYACEYFIPLSAIPCRKAINGSSGASMCKLKNLHVI